MALIAGFDISKSKTVFLGLCGIFGIHKNRAVKICKRLGISLNYETNRLTEEQIKDVELIIKKYNFLVGDDLKKFRKSKSDKLIQLKTYRGLRRLRGYPIRGQRTHTNAKSAKKNRKD